MNTWQRLRQYFFPPPNIIKLQETVIARKGKAGLKYDSEFSFYLPDLRGREWLFPIPTKTYIAYKAKPRNQSNADENYWRYVTPNEASIFEITTGLTERYIGSRWQKRQKDVADLVVDFVHQIPYQERETSYVKYPVETLCEFGGNCVDLSVLGATMLEIAGIESCFVATDDHLFLGINVPCQGYYVQYGGKKYYTVEMAGTDFPSEPITDKIGQKNNFNLNEIEILTRKRLKIKK